MKIAITGGAGQLAQSYQKVDQKNEIFLLSRKDLDITNEKEVEEVLGKINPDYIFHFASLTRRLDCAHNKDLAYKVNVDGTKNIVNFCKKYKKKLLFISTNEVFSGQKNDFYYEDDLPNPVSTVGKTKYEAEKYVQQELKDFFIVRTSWLYSQWSHNFLQTIIKIAQEKKALKIVGDEVGSPTYSVDLAQAILELVQTTQYGIYHLNNQGKASRYEFAVEIFKNHPIKNLKISEVKLSDFSNDESPPLFTPLASNKLQKVNIKIPSWDKSLSSFLNKS